MGLKATKTDEGESDQQSRRTATAVSTGNTRQINFHFVRIHGLLDHTISMDCTNATSLDELFKRLCYENKISADDFVVLSLWGKTVSLDVPAMPGTYVVESTRLPVYYFNEDLKKWSILSCPSVKNCKVDSLKLLTYNVWFDTLQQEKRFKHLLQVISSLSPHVIALQEMTKPTLQYLLDDPFIQNHYYLSDNEAVTSFGASHYGNCILLDRNVFQGGVDTFRFMALPSKYGRRFIYCDALLNEENWKFGVCHFDSGGNNQFRAKQLEIISQKLLEPFSPISPLPPSPPNLPEGGPTTSPNTSASILMGDFNWGSDQEMKDLLDKLFFPKGFNDYGRNIGHTFDKNIVKMTSENTTKTNQQHSKDEKNDEDCYAARLDMILGHTGHDEGEYSIQKLGVEPIDNNLWISDHFGLFMELHIHT